MSTASHQVIYVSKDGKLRLTSDHEGVHSIAQTAPHPPPPNAPGRTHRLSLFLTARRINCGRLRRDRRHKAYYACRRRRLPMAFPRPMHMIYHQARIPARLELRRTIGWPQLCPGAPATNKVETKHLPTRKQPRTARGGGQGGRRGLVSVSARGFFFCVAGETGCSGGARGDAIHGPRCFTNRRRAVKVKRNSKRQSSPLVSFPRTGITPFLHNVLARWPRATALGPCVLYLTLHASQRHASTLFPLHVTAKFLCHNEESFNKHRIGLPMWVALRYHVSVALALCT